MICRLTLGHIEFHYLSQVFLDKCHASSLGDVSPSFLGIQLHALSNIVPRDHQASSHTPTRFCFPSPSIQGISTGFCQGGEMGSSNNALAFLCFLIDLFEVVSDRNVAITNYFSTISAAQNGCSLFTSFKVQATPR